ncbi:MAG: glycoside hydrolase family 10 protein, partial [Ruminococcus sp.]
MKYKICLSMFAVALLIAAVTLNSYNIAPVDTKTVSINTRETTPPATTAKKADNQNEKKDEIMKGLWVTYMELDMSDTDRSYDSFKNKFDTIVNDAIDCGFNTLIVQVRPFSDALYYSEYYPHSHILSGVQGKDPGYDALKYMCEKSHESGLEIHAWVNPFRISTNDTPSKLSNDNPYVLDESIGVKTDTGIFINPAIKKARDLIVNGVKEIVENYDVDGIQFDDYFYPTKDKSFDNEEYNSYIKAQSGEAMKLSQWRKDNVNNLIKATYKAVHSSKDDVVFGISPQGNIKNNDEI